MFKLMDKKIIALLRKLFFLNWPYGSYKHSKTCKQHLVVRVQSKKSCEKFGIFTILEKKNPFSDLLFVSLNSKSCLES